MSLEIKLARRSLAAAPVFLVAVVVTLGLVVGANAAIFSVADAILFRALPYAAPDRLFVLRLINHQTGVTRPFVPYDLIDLIQKQFAVGTVALRGPIEVTPHLGPNGKEWMSTTRIAPDYLQILGIHPARGRLLNASDLTDPGGSALLSFETWQRRFGADENIIGRTVQLGTKRRTVVGVLPSEFIFPSAYTRFPYLPADNPQYDFVTVARKGRRLTNDVIIRLADDISTEQAQAMIDAALTAAPANRENAQRLVLVEIRSLLFPAGRPVTLALLGAAFVVLLLGCATISNLMLARSVAREHDFGLYLALGATRSHLMRLTLVESGIIAVAGAVLALALMPLMSKLLVLYVPRAFSGDIALGPSWRVAAFGLLVGLFSGCVFAVVPALHCGTVDALPLIRGVRHQGRKRVALFHPMTVIQVVLAIVLISGFAMAARVYVSMRTSFGFEPSDVAVVDFSPSQQAPAALRAVFVRVVERLQSRGDILHVGATGSVPLTNPRANEIVPLGDQELFVVHVLPGYFEAAMIPLRAGRFLTWTDLRTNSRAAMVSEAAAKGLFRDGDAIGRTFKNDEGEVYTAVGVVGDIRSSYEKTFAPLAYVIPDHKTKGFTVVARLQHRNAVTLQELKKEVTDLVPDAVVTARWWDQAIVALPPYQNPRFISLVLGAFAVLSLIVTALGMFSVATLHVSTYVREMAIRAALGASPASLIARVVARVLVPVWVGILTALCAMPALGRVAASQFSGVPSADFVMGAIGAVIVLAASLAAACMPVRRICRPDLVALLQQQ